MQQKGPGNSNYGRHHSAEYKAKMSRMMKERWQSPEFRQGVLSKMRLLKDHRGTVFEKRLLPALKAEFDFVERAVRVCDFIALKKGKIYLIETKSKDLPHKFTAIQKTAREMFGDSYLVRGYAPETKLGSSG